MFKCGFGGAGMLGSTTLDEGSTEQPGAASAATSIGDQFAPAHEAVDGGATGEAEVGGCF